MAQDKDVHLPGELLSTSRAACKISRAGALESRPYSCLLQSFAGCWVVFVSATEKTTLLHWTLYSTSFP